MFIQMKKIKIVSSETIHDGHTKILTLAFVLNQYTGIWQKNAMHEIGVYKHCATVKRLQNL